MKYTKYNLIFLSYLQDSNAFQFGFDWFDDIIYIDIHRERIEIAAKVVGKPKHSLV